MLRPFRESLGHNPGDGQADDNLRFEQTDGAIERYLQSISQTCKTLHVVSLPFTKTQAVLPAHCNRAINSLAEINTLVQKLSKILDQISPSHDHFTVLHYRLLYILFVIKERIDDLSCLIDSYVLSCRQPASLFATKQLHYISHSFETLLQKLTNLPLRIEQLKDDPSVHEKDLEDEHVPETVLYFTHYYHAMQANIER